MREKENKGMSDGRTHAAMLSSSPTVKSSRKHEGGRLHFPRLQAPPRPALPLTVLGTSSSLEEDPRGSGSNSELGPALHLGILGQGWARIQL